MKTRLTNQEKQQEELKLLPVDPRARKAAINKMYWERNKEERNAAQRAYYHRIKMERREALNQRNREQYERMYKTALERIGATYGVVCRCCGEHREVFLAIHHVDGGGNQHRKSFSSQHAYYKYLATEAPLDKFQILCHNCNIAEKSGPCPHKLEREQVRAA